MVGLGARANTSECVLAPTASAPDCLSLVGSRYPMSRTVLGFLSFRHSCKLNACDRAWHSHLFAKSSDLNERVTFSGYFCAFLPQDSGIPTFVSTTTKRGRKTNFLINNLARISRIHIGCILRLESKTHRLLSFRSVSSCFVKSISFERH